MFRKPWLVSSTALMTLAFQVGLAHAQSTPQPAGQAATEVDEIVVTGFRGSLQNALNQKRRSDVQIDAISADDIASFPEANIAESLQRIPGVSVDRDNGEGRQISVRGLGGDFTRVRINGMEALSTNGSTSAGVNNPNTSRGFDFNTFASQLFSNARVQKSASAQTDEGSLGATVDLTTSRPFDFRRQRMAFSAENAHYVNGGYNNPRLAGLYSNRWLDGRVGLLLSAAYQERDTTISNYWRATSNGELLYRGMNWAGNEYPQRSRFAAPTGTTFNQSVQVSGSRCGGQTSGPTTPIGTICNIPSITNPLVIAAMTGSDPDAYAALFPASNATPGRFDDSTVIIPSLSGLVRQDLNTERTGLTGSFQFQLSDRTRLTVDGLYSQFNQTSNNSGVETVGISRNNTSEKLNKLNWGATATDRRALYPNECDFRAGSDTIIGQDCGQQIYGASLVPGYAYSYNPKNLDVFDYYNNPLSPGYAPNTYGINGLIPLMGAPTTRVLGAHVTNGVADYLALSNLDWRAQANRTSYETEFQQVSALLDHQFNDKFKVSALIGGSRSTTFAQHLFVEFNSLDRPETFIYDARDGGDMPIWNPGFDVANPANWSIVKGLSVMRNNITEVENKFQQAGLDFQWDANDSWTLLFGGSVKKYDFITSARGRNLDAINPTELEAGVTAASLGRVREFGKGLSTPDGTPNSFFAPDIDAFIATFGFNCDCINEYGDFRTDSRRSNMNAGNFTVSEQDTAFYAQANYRGELFGRSLSGNLGVRTVETSVDAAGRTPVGLAVSDSNSYRDTLPSLNISYEVMKNLYLRVGASKAMARPFLGNLSPSIGSISVPSNGNIAGGTVTVGNTKLDPFRSDNVDVSLEWYFRPDSLLSVAVFNKDIGSYPQTVLYDASLSELMDPASIALLRQQFTNLNQLAYLDNDYPFVIRQAQNAPGGYLRGIEANFQTNFFFLPGFWSNFGMQLNATRIDSELTYILDPGARSNGAVTTEPTYGAGPWLNASPKAVNFTLYYQVKGFTARTSLAWRSDYYSSYPIVAGSCTPGLLPPSNTSTPAAASATSNPCTSPLINDFVTAEGTLNVDAAVNWNINRRLSLRFEALNITDEVNNRSTYSQHPQTTVYGASGPQYTIGLRYRY